MSTQTTAQQLIEVVLTWGRDIVEVRHLDATHASLTVGTHPDDDLFLPLAHAASVELLSRTPHGWVVRPLDGGAAVLVGDVASRPGGEDLARYDVGPFAVTVRRVPRARRLTLVPVFDALWANVATVTMAAMAAVVAIAVFMPRGLRDAEPDLSLTMPRFTTLALKTAPEKRAPVDDDDVVAAPAPSGPRAPAKEPGTRALPRRDQARDADVVAGKLAMLFGDDAAGLGGLAGGGDALMAALGDISGPRIVAGGAISLKPGPGGVGGVAGTGTYALGRLHVGQVVGGADAPGGGLGEREERVPGIVADKEPVVPPSIDKELIRKVVRAHLDQARACYERSLQAAPGLAGKVTLRWTIAADGRVTQAAPVRDGARNALDDVGGCLANAVRTWRFPVFPQAPTAGVVVQYPFVFKAG